MPLMTEAINKEEWERIDKGLPPLPKKKVVIQPPKLPKIDNQITFKDIPLDRFDKLISARRRTIKNEDGITFIGMDIVIELKGEKRLGRPPKLENEEESHFMQKTIKGWMLEGDWHKLYLHIRERVDFKVIVI